LILIIRFIHERSVLKEKAHRIDVAVESCESERSITVRVTEIKGRGIFPNGLV
jgi:hypothetical protein